MREEFRLDDHRLLWQVALAKHFEVALYKKLTIYQELANKNCRMTCRANAVNYGRLVGHLGVLLSRLLAH